MCIRDSDRPFSGSQRQVYPGRGFKGNRIIYRDVCESNDFDDAMGHTDVFDKRDLPKKNVVNDEPIYSEPVFAKSFVMSQSPDSGYISYPTYCQGGSLSSTNNSGNRE